MRLTKIFMAIFAPDEMLPSSATLDQIWFVWELVIWPKEVTLVTRTHPSGPLCLWQCLMVSLNINTVNDFFICWQLTCILFCSSSIKYSRVSHCFHPPLQYSNVLWRGSLLALKLLEVNTDLWDLISASVIFLEYQVWEFKLTSVGRSNQD